MARWLKKENLDKIKRIEETVLDQLTSSLKEGIKEGETLAELAGRIKHIHKNAGNRALTIARTEVGRAANHGAYEEAKEQGTEGHVWVTAQDKAVRDIHASMHGQFRKIGEPFVDGNGNELLYPQDGAAPASTTVNCRCNLRERIAKE